MSDPTPAQRYDSVGVDLRWGDMDAFGHVNNVTYHQILEEARVRAFADWFDGGGTDGSLRTTVLLARQEVEFLAQLTYSARPVLVDMWVTHIGGASWDMGYEMREGDATGTVYARAESTLVVYDPQAGRPRSLTGEERTALQARLGEPVAMRRRR